MVSFKLCFPFFLPPPLHSKLTQSFFQTKSLSKSLPFPLPLSLLSHAGAGHWVVTGKWVGHTGYCQPQRPLWPPCESLWRESHFLQHLLKCQRRSKPTVWLQRSIGCSCLFCRQTATTSKQHQLKDPRKSSLPRILYVKQECQILQAAMSVFQGKGFFLGAS